MIDYFIVFHNENDIEKMLTNNFFNKFKFLYVGLNKNKNKNKKIIKCNQLKDNIERFPSLCSYTAWYAVAKNNLNKNNYVCMLEYDNLFSKNFLENNIKHIKENTILSYSETLLDHYVFLKSTPWLEISLKKIYDIDLYDFVNTYKEKFKYWSTTTNKTMQIEVLNKFIDWYEPMNCLFREQKLGAYVHERAFFIFCIINNISINYIENMIIHKQKSSHGIQDIYGKFLMNKNTTVLTEDMKKEYDIIYNQELYNSIKLITN
jgi:hypothetical protein